MYYPFIRNLRRQYAAYSRKRRQVLHIRAKCCLQAAAEVDGLDPDAALKAWEEFRIRRAGLRDLGQRANLKRRLPRWSDPEWLMKLDQQVAKQREEVAQEAAIEVAARSSAYLARKKLREEKRLEKARAERAAAKAAVAEAERIRIQRRDEKMAKKEADQAAINEAQATSVDVDINPDASLLEDIRWLYARLGRLIVVPDPTNPKARFLNEELLKDAPSSGCVALAELYRDSPTDFIKMFVTKLLPRDAAVAPAAKADEDAEDVDSDPDLDDLRGWLNA